MVIDRRFRRDGHLHRFHVAEDSAGWRVLEEEDALVLRDRHRDDWHRVERDRCLFDLTAIVLASTGWSESPGDDTPMLSVTPA
jgi:hypothetical protein